MPQALFGMRQREKVTKTDLAQMQVHRRLEPSFDPIRNVTPPFIMP